MEVVSPPAIIDIPVTFLDIMYVGGIPDSITLRDEDQLELLAENIAIVTKCPPIGALNTDEHIIIERRNVLSFRYRKGVIRKLVPPARPSAPSENGPLPAS